MVVNRGIEEQGDHGDYFKDFTGVGMGTILKTLVVLGCRLGALGVPQGGSVGVGGLYTVMSYMSGLDEEMLEAVTDTTSTATADSCSAGSETLDKVPSALGDMSEVTQLLMVGYYGTFVLVKLIAFLCNDIESSLGDIFSRSMSY